MKSRHNAAAFALLIVAAALVLDMSACRLPAAGPARPGPEIIVSEAAAQAADRKLRAVGAQIAQGRPFTLVLTQHEASAWLVRRVEAYAAHSGEAPPLESMRIYFDDGVVRLYGIHRAGAITARLHVTIVLTITPAGGLDAQVMAAQAGAISPHAAMLEAVNRAVHDSLDALWASLSADHHYRVTALSVADGVLTLRAEP